MKWQQYTKDDFWDNDGDYDDDRCDYIPDDGYDYEKHMAKPVVGVDCKTMVMVPPDLEELSKDPVFTGELECNLDLMDTEERELVVCMQKSESDELTEVNDVFDVETMLKDDILPSVEIGKRIAHNLIWNGMKNRNYLTAEQYNDTNVSCDNNDKYSNSILGQFEGSLHVVDSEEPAISDPELSAAIEALESDTLDDSDLTHLETHADELNQLAVELGVHCESSEFSEPDRQFYLNALKKYENEYNMSLSDGDSGDHDSNICVDEFHFDRNAFGNLIPAKKLSHLTPAKPNTLSEPLQLADLT